MNKLSLNEQDAIDRLVQETFPYPIALSYHQMLQTSDPAQRTIYALRVFQFSIRTIAFTTVIQYIYTPSDVLNNDILNQTIENKLKRPFTIFWVTLLRDTLRAYHHHRDWLFIPKLYDLYWNAASDEPITPSAVWPLLERMAVLCTDVLLPPGKVNPAAIADEVLDELRQVMSFFAFIRNYELWFVRSKDERHLTVEVYRGQEKSIRNPPLASIREPAVAHINPKYFYLKDSQNRLMELHPLVISADYIQDMNRDDTGVYEEFHDPEVSSSRDSELLYFMLRGDKLQQAFARGAGREAVALFLELYRQLGEKHRAFAALQPVNAATLRTQSLAHSAQQTKNAMQKYIQQAYIERDAFNTLLTTFLATEEPVLILSGNLGVGKTNLLLHFYLHQLHGLDDTVPLWFDGATLKTEIGLSRSVLAAWDTLDFEQPDDEAAATVTLRHILEQNFANRQLVLLIDGVNENNTPMQLFAQINDFAFRFQTLKVVKVIATTRPQVWQQARNKYMRLQYRTSNYFRTLPDELRDIGISVENDSFVLRKYTPQELETAYRKYTEHYVITGPELGQLSRSLRQASQEPLLLRFVCETHKGNEDKHIEGHIPEDKQADEIIGDLIDSYTQNPEVNLRAEDFEFLRRWIVPQFFRPGGTPVAVLTRRMLLEVQVPVGDGRATLSLDQLITDPSEYSDGTSVNVQAQRLMDTGWLVLEGSLSNYTIRFRYEYYYDYFVGKYVLERYGVAADKLAFFSELISHLNAAPFLWGTLRNLLIDLLKRGKFSFIQQLGYTTEPLQSELLVNVLSEYYQQYAEQLEPILSAWIHGKAHDLAAQTATNISIVCGIEQNLDLLLQHSNRALRSLVTQHIYNLWMSDPNLAIRLMSRLAKSISILKPKQIVDNLYTLIACSILLFVQSNSNAHTHNEIDRQLSQIWKSVLAKLLLRTNLPILETVLKEIRRLLLKITVNRIIQTIRNLQDKNLVLDMNEVIQFFPISPQRKAICEYMLKHIDAASGDPSTSIEELTDYLIGLIDSGDTDLMTGTLMLCVLTAHVFNTPLKTAHALQKINKRIAEHYPATQRPQNPTGSSWSVIALMPYLNYPYPDLDRTIAIEIVQLFADAEFQHQEKFLGSWTFSTGKTGRLGMSGGISWAYMLDDSVFGPEMLKRHLDLLIRRKDQTGITKLVSDFMEVAPYLGQPRAGILAVRDALLILQNYLNENQLFRTQFLTLIVDRLAFYYGVRYQDYLLDFAEMTENEIPNDILIRLKSAPPESLDYVLGQGASELVREGLTGNDPAIRNIIKEAVASLFDSKNLETWMMNLVTTIANRVYGESIL